MSRFQYRALATLTVVTATLALTGFVSDFYTRDMLGTILDAVLLSFAIGASVALFSYRKE